MSINYLPITKKLPKSIVFWVLFCIFDMSCADFLMLAVRPKTGVFLNSGFFMGVCLKGGFPILFMFISPFRNKLNYTLTMCICVGNVPRLPALAGALEHCALSSRLILPSERSELFRQKQWRFSFGLLAGALRTRDSSVQASMRWPCVRLLLQPAFCRIWSNLVRWICQRRR